MAKKNIDYSYNIHQGWMNMLTNTLKAHNIDVHTLMSEFDIYANKDGEYDIRKLRRLHKHAIASSRNQLFSADMANYITPFSFGCYSLMLWTSPNINQLIHDAARYFIFIAPQLRLKVVERNDVVEVWIINNNSTKSNKVTNLGIITTISLLLTIVMKATGKPLPSSEYYTPDKNDYPEETKKLEQRFNSKIFFRASHRRLVFDRKELDGTLIHSCNEVYQANMVAVQRRVILLNKEDTVLQINSIFDQSETLQNITINTVASKMNTSPRTLNRKLTQVGTTFTTTLENYRLEKALQLLKEPNTPITTIAYHLGFSELSSFSRAFKRWTGSCPTQIEDYPT